MSLAMEGSFENEFAKFWIKDDIFFIEYKPNVVINLEAAQRIVGDRLQMKNEKTYPVLCDIRCVVDSDKAARDYMALNGYLLTRAVAIVVQGSISTSMISFYLTIHKPQVPIRVFTEKSTALEFLKSFL